MHLRAHYPTYHYSSKYICTRSTIISFISCSGNLSPPTPLVGSCIASHQALRVVGHTRHCGVRLACCLVSKSWAIWVIFACSLHLLFLSLYLEWALVGFSRSWVQMQVMGVVSHVSEPFLILSLPYFLLLFFLLSLLVCFCWVPLLPLHPVSCGFGLGVGVRWVEGGKGMCG